MPLSAGSEQKIRSKILTTLCWVRMDGNPIFKSRAALPSQCEEPQQKVGSSSAYSKDAAHSRRYLKAIHSTLNPGRPETEAGSQRANLIESGKGLKAEVDWPVKQTREAWSQLRTCKTVLLRIQSRGQVKTLCSALASLPCLLY